MKVVVENDIWVFLLLSSRVGGEFRVRVSLGAFFIELMAVEVGVS